MLSRKTGIYISDWDIRLSLIQYLILKFPEKVGVT